MVVSLNKSTSIVFIDSKVDDYLSLIPGIALETKIVLLDSATDALEKITVTLQTVNYQEVHLISHGSPGCLYLGNNQLSLDTLSKYTDLLSTWFSRNSQSPTLLLYGCNVAAGDAGAEFIAQLKQLTGAEIAATAKLTGNEALGGDWELEKTTAEINVSLAVDELTRLNYQGVLTTFTVTTDQDQDSEDTEGSDLALREAIKAANNTAGSDVITFDSNVSNIELTIGELKITDSVTIKGLGANSLTIDGANQNFPVFSIGDQDANAGINVTIDGLTITGGNNPESGGGISNLENLNLNNSVVSGNTSSKDGGGIFNYIGTTTISNSEISGNTAEYGGGVSNYFGATTVTSSTISGNTAKNDGGGVYNYVGALVVGTTEITDNSADVGGGLNNYSGATVVIGSTISGNSANSDGGGVYNYKGETSISYSTISNNSGDFGGGVASDAAESNTTISSSTISGNTANIGGGVSNYEGNVAITSSTLSGNTANVEGGGVSNYFGATNITNSTISGNSAGDGGAVNNFNGNTSILSSTISGNSADNGSGINNYYAQTGVTSSIVAGNNNSQDVAGKSFVSGGSNLIGNGDGTSFTNDVNGDLVGTTDSPIDPKLGELQDNGGFTETQRPLFGSLAIDASNDTSLPTDQRGFGFNRPGGKANDIGAFEIQDGGEYVVTTLDDEDDGDLSREDISLREAILNSNQGDIITFDSKLSGGTITLALGELLINKNLTIDGLGADNLTIDAHQQSRIFNIDDGNSETYIDVTLNRISITNGQVAVEETDNTGGGILNQENTTLSETTISNNSANQGGGIFNNAGELIINNSTISSNSGVTGGGIDNSNEGVLTLSNSTISNNFGGGVSNHNSATVNSSIIANNTSSDVIFTTVTPGTNTDDDVIGTKAFTSGGNNLIGRVDGFGSSAFNSPSAAGFVDGVNGDIVGTAEGVIDPRLGELQDNGGATFTQALLDGSPAIDAGSNPNNLVTDQRGDGFNRTVGNGTDIGAFEVQYVVTTLDDEDDGDLSQGDISLREAILNINQGDTITFDSELSGGTINLSLGELLIDKTLTIDGLGANNLTIDATDIFGRVFNIDDGKDETKLDVSINGLTITGGEAARQMSPGDTNPDTYGGGISNRENLSLSNSHVTGNSALAGGGGIFNGAGALTISNSTISDNSSESSRVGASGGGIFNQDGVLTINNSTISDNSAFFAGGILSLGVTAIGNSTINGNTATVSVGGISGTNVTLTSSIVAGNINDQNTASNNGNDLGGEFTSGGNNLIGDSGAVESFIDGVNGDIVGTTDNPIDPQLGELQNNGGVTPTQALLDTSPAIDAGSNPNNLVTDQRGEGFNRTMGNGTDIGAFEVQNPLGTAGDDTLFGGADSNKIKGLQGNDLILGEAGSDRLNGNNGNDIINGGADDDIIRGGAGQDFLDGGKDNDQLFGNDGSDTVKGGAGDDVVRGDADDDIVSGGAGMDSLFGGNGNDIINGDTGNDLIRGDAGNDLIIGGEGSDTILGGDGLDVFFLDSYQGQDLITDFMDGVDLFHLSDGLSFGSLSIVNNESNSAAVIQDTTNNNLVVAMIANVQAEAITSEDFINL